jgi:Fe-S-cluster-containing hydrogenase component 2
MQKDIYRRLAEHLDNLPGGFPPTQTGVELRILRRLFSPEEAELALHLTLIAEEPRVVARRAGVASEVAARRLERMAGKGLILRAEAEGQPSRYSAVHYAVGIWEFQVNNLDRGLIQDMNEYVPTLFAQAWKFPQMRTIPAGRSLTPQHEVLPYEVAEELVRNQKRFGVRPCICRRERRMMGEGCDKPEETCLVFGMGVDYDRRNGVGRVIDLQETLEILSKAEEAGLVLQPSNSKSVLWICCCCGCCCQVLKAFKRHPRPGELVSSAFVATVDAESCEGCAICIDRCQMQALQLVDDKVVLAQDRCIGCGLCVSTCPTGSLQLVRKPDSAQPRVPADMEKTYVKLARQRGKLGGFSLLRMVAQSKVDRLLAPR